MLLLLHRQKSLIAAAAAAAGVSASQQQSLPDHMDSNRKKQDQGESEEEGGVSSPPAKQKQEQEDDTAVAAASEGASGPPPAASSSPPPPAESSTEAEESAETLAAGGPRGTASADKPSETLPDGSSAAGAGAAEQHNKNQQQERRDDAPAAAAAAAGEATATEAAASTPAGARAGSEERGSEELEHPAGCAEHLKKAAARFRALMERRERRLEEAMSDPQTRTDLEAMFPGDDDYHTTLLAGVRGMEEGEFQELLSTARKRRRGVSVVAKKHLFWPWFFYGVSRCLFSRVYLESSPATWKMKATTDLRNFRGRWRGLDFCNKNTEDNTEDSGCGACLLRKVGFRGPRCPSPRSPSMPLVHLAAAATTSARVPDPLEARKAASC